MNESDIRATSPREIALIIVSMAVTSTIALFGIPSSLQSMLALGAEDKDRGTATEGEIDVHSPVFALATTASDYIGGSYIVHCDGVAEVSVGDQRGFRVLLKRDKDLDHVGYGTRNNWDYADLVLVPVTKVPAPPVDEVPWQQMDPEGTPLAVFMGTGYEFHWYGHMKLSQQDRLRTKLNLTGGEDRLGLLVQNIDSATDRRKRGDAIRYLATAMGEDALPILEREINENLYSCRDVAIRALGTIGSEGSVYTLLKLYDSPDSESVARAVLSGSNNVRAKEVYLDNLKMETLEKPFFISTLRSVMHHQWEEAIPLLEEITEAPYTPRYYIHATAAIRALRGNPIPEILTTHEATIRDLCCGSTPDEVDAARRSLLEHPDSQGAILMAVKLTTAEGKGSRAPMEIGIELLHALPQDEVLPLVEHLGNTLNDVKARNLFNEIYRSIKGLKMENIAKNYG